MKEFDLFVRNAEVQVGIFATVAEEPPPQMGNLDEYRLYRRAERRIN